MTDTPGNDLAKTRLFKQLIDPGLLSIRCMALGQPFAWLINKHVFELFMERMDSLMLERMDSMMINN